MYVNQHSNKCIYTRISWKASFHQAVPLPDVRNPSIIKIIEYIKTYDIVVKSMYNTVKENEWTKSDSRWRRYSLSTLMLNEDKISVDTVGSQKTIS